MKKLLWIILSILVISIVFNVILYNKKKITNITIKQSIEKIDSIETKIDSIYIIKTKIEEKIDTVFIKLEENKVQYEKDFDIIRNNDINEDYVFFREYIESNRERLDSIGNCL